MYTANEGGYCWASMKQQFVEKTVDQFAPNMALSIHANDHKLLGLYDCKPNGLISDSECGIKPLCTGMREVLQ